MDEMTMVRKLLAEAPPDARVVEEGRERVFGSTTPGTRRTRTVGRPVLRGALVLGITGAVTAAALVVAALMQDTPTPPNGGVPSTEVSARQVLLTAAVSAESVPTDGAYWHLRASSRTTLPQKFGQSDSTYKLEHLSVTEEWTTNEGRTWLGQREWARPATPDDEAAWRSDGSPSKWCDGRTDTDPSEPNCLHTSPGTASLTRVGEDAFVVAEGRELTFDQLQRLPDDPDGLRAWVDDAVRDDLDASASAEILDLNVADVLANLLVDVPAPPEVRAAAYRALADMPNVKSVGPMRDELGRAGFGIEIDTPADEVGIYIVGAGSPVKVDELTRTLIIDPDTSHVLASEESAGEGTDPFVSTQYLEVGWTNEEPREPSAVS